MKETIEFLNAQLDRLQQSGYEVEDRDAWTNNILSYMDTIREIESSNDPTKVNTDTSAAGLYQFTPDTVPTGKNRATRMHTNQEFVETISDNPLEWTPDQAGLMFLAHAFGSEAREDRRGSDELFYLIGAAPDQQAKQDLYYDYHYRAAPDEKTILRVNEFIPLLKNLGGSVTSPLYSDRRYII